MTSYHANIGVFEDVANLVNTLIREAFPDTPKTWAGIRQILVELRDEFDTYFIPEYCDQTQVAQDVRITNVCETMTRWLSEEGFQGSLVTVVPLDESGAVLFVFHGD